MVRLPRTLTGWRRFWRPERFILGTKAPGLAAAPIRVPSTRKCSSDSKLSASASHTTSSTRARPASCASSRYRFLVNTRGIEAALDQAHVQEPAERQVVCEFHADGALAAHRVQGNQQRGLSSRSGGTEARPTLAYMRSNAGDRRARAASATALSRRRGWSFGIRSPGPQWPVSCVGRWVDRAWRVPPDWMTPVPAEGVSEQSAVAVMVVAILTSHAGRQLGVPRSWITRGVS